MTPDYCPYTMRISYSRLSDSDTAMTICGQNVANQSPYDCLTNSDNEAKFSWTKGLFILPETQTCTIDVTSTSKYTTKNPAKSGQGSWDLTFENPCCNTNLVDILPASLPRIDYTLFSGE